MTKKIKAPITAEYFATLNKDEIILVANAWPPHKLTQNQIALSREEHDMLASLKVDLQTAYGMMGSILDRIKAHKGE